MMPDDHDREMASILAILTIIGWLFIIWLIPST